MNAQRARGVDFGEGNLLQKIRSFIPILALYLLPNLKHADALALAMRQRVQGGEGRSRYRQLKWKLCR